MSDKIEVSKESLGMLLVAITGPPHYIMELKVTMNLPGSEPNCLETIINEYNSSIENKG